MHFVIGDVHGHYQTLLHLINILPDNAELIFVGDLIDRGIESAEVVRYVRDNNHLCVMGNHEAMMIKYGKDLLAMNENVQPYSTMWIHNGGLSTLRSYGLLNLLDKTPKKDEDHNKKEKQFVSDLEWMERLSLYIQLDFLHDGKPIIISHASIADVWSNRHNATVQESFQHAALENRRKPTLQSDIFNIFGHTPVHNGVEISDQYVNVDSGCYMHFEGFGKLSAYCIENGDVVTVDKIRDRPKMNP